MRSWTSFHIITNATKEKDLLLEFKFQATKRVQKQIKIKFHKNFDFYVNNILFSCELYIFNLNIHSSQIWNMLKSTWKYGEKNLKLCKFNFFLQFNYIYYLDVQSVGHCMSSTDNHCGCRHFNCTKMFQSFLMVVFLPLSFLPILIQNFPLIFSTSYSEDGFYPKCLLEGIKNLSTSYIFKIKKSNVKVISKYTD